MKKTSILNKFHTKICWWSQRLKIWMKIVNSMKSQSLHSRKKRLSSIQKLKRKLRNWVYWKMLMKTLNLVIPRLYNKWKLSSKQKLQNARISYAMNFWRIWMLLMKHLPPGRRIYSNLTIYWLSSRLKCKSNSKMLQTKTIDKVNTYKHTTMIMWDTPKRYSWDSNKKEMKSMSSWVKLNWSTKKNYKD